MDIQQHEVNLSPRLSEEDIQVLMQLLKGTSRSFYLTIKTLPEVYRLPLMFAYLLARFSDSLADTSCFSIEEKQVEMKRWQAFWSKKNKEQEIYFKLIISSDCPAEQELIEKISWVFEKLQSQRQRIQELIFELQAKISTGQLWELNFFQAQNPQVNCRLESLDQYTYWVAGSVGKFWTELGFYLEDNFSKEEKKNMIKWGIGYGKGLQLINILRDVEADRKMNRNYFEVSSDSAEWLSAWESQWKQAQVFLNQGQKYLDNISNKELLFSMSLPLVLGRKTLKKLWKSRKQVAYKRLKISRFEVFTSVIKLKIQS